MSRLVTLSALAALISFSAGCGETKYEEYNKAAENEKSSGHGHAHAEHGPHGGHLIELSDKHEFHGEATVEDGAIVFYVLGADCKTAAPADSVEFEIESEDGEEKELESTPKPLDGETAEKCSCFAIDSSSLGTLKDLEGVEAHVHVMIGGEEYTGELAHDHEGHESHEGHDAHEKGDGHADHDEDDEKHHGDKDGHGHDEDDEKHHGDKEDGHGHDKDAKKHDDKDGSHDEDGEKHPGDDPKEEHHEDGDKDEHKHEDGEKK